MEDYIKYTDLEEARDMADFLYEDLEAGESILIMKKDDHFIITSYYRGAKENGYELYESMYKPLEVE